MAYNLTTKPYAVATKHPFHYSNNGARRHQTEKVDKNNQTRRKAIELYGGESTMHGVRFIISRTHQNKLLRLLWAIVVLACIAAAVYYVQASIARYYAFDVKTTTSMKYVSDVTFPAITFANTNLVRRSMVAGSKVTLEGIAPLVPPAYANTDCYDSSKANDTFSREIDVGYDWWKKVGIAYGARALFPDSSDVVRCWWQQNEVDCGVLFLNHFCDTGWCFTFNPDRGVIRAYNLLPDRAAYGMLYTAYGVNGDYRNFTLNAAGPTNGLELLLNVHQEEYCLPMARSVGHRVIVHDQRVQPLFFLESPLLLAPGFETSVAITLTKLEKHTEELGRCTMFRRLHLMPNTTVYFKEACYLQCFSEFVFGKCACMPHSAAPHANLIKAADLNVSYVPICWGPNLTCSQAKVREFLMAGIDHICGKCEDPCTETKYTVRTSFALFPSALEARRLFPNTTRTVDEIRKNYALVHFYVESKLLNIVTEDRDFGPEELLSSIGGTIGFYLGMSIISGLEIIELIVFLLFPALASSDEGCPAADKAQEPSVDVESGAHIRTSRAASQALEQERTWGHGVARRGRPLRRYY